MKKYTYFTDAGHGWLKVSKKEIEPIKDKISRFSYMKGDFVYLEEDCDMDLFLTHAFPEWTNADIGKHIDVKYSVRSKIRNYEFYIPQ